MAFSETLQQVLISREVVHVTDTVSDPEHGLHHWLQGFADRPRNAVDGVFWDSVANRKPCCQAELSVDLTPCCCYAPTLSDRGVYLQIRPDVIPLLQHLLTEGTFKAAAVLAKPDSQHATSSTGQADTESDEEEAPDMGGRAGQEEQSRARLIFTSEQPLPWLEKLSTQIKVCFLSDLVAQCFTACFQLSN